MDLHKLERWSHGNLMKCEVLQLVWDSPKHKYRLCREWTESRSEEKIDVTQKCVLAARKAKCILSCIRRTMTKCQGSDSILLLRSQENPYGVCVQLWDSQCKDLDLLEWVQWGGQKDDQRAGAVLLWGQPEKLKLFSLQKTRPWRGPFSAFQYLKGPTRKLEMDLLEGHVVTQLGRIFKLERG